MTPNKRRKLAHEGEHHTQTNETSSGSESESSSAHGSSRDTEEEITQLQLPRKSKKTAKRKHRAVEATQFGLALQSLLETKAPNDLPLSLKPSVGRKLNDEKLENRAKRALEGEKREMEEIGRVQDVIGGWGGESERSLRKVAQRGVVKLFNTIQQAQNAADAAAEELQSKRGSGKPTLPAPAIGDKKLKGKHAMAKSKAKEGEIVLKLADMLSDQYKSALDPDGFLNLIRSGGVVPKI